MTKSGRKVVFYRYFLLLNVFGHEISYYLGCRSPQIKTYLYQTQLKHVQKVNCE